jgi:hypothetical protein
MSVVTLAQFLAEKKPRIESRSYYGDEVVLELVGEREVGAQVGVLRLRRVSLLELDGADVLCHVEETTAASLLADQRGKADQPEIDPDNQVYLFHAPGGWSYYCVAQGLEFSFRPWIDLSLTELARRRNAESGHAAQRAVSSHLAASSAEMLGREVVCLRCLRSFNFEKDDMDCPGCKASPGGCLCPEGMLRSFFHSEELLRQSGCQLLSRQPADVLECYRLVVFSYWGHHRVAEVRRGPTSATVLARCWHWQNKGWMTTADRPLTPAEWGRFSQLIDLAPFWELPPHGGHSGLDGADYALEGLKEGQYHFVKRWSPDPSTDQENFSFPCECLLEWSG